MRPLPLHSASIRKGTGWLLHFGEAAWTPTRVRSELGGSHPVRRLA